MAVSLYRAADYERCLDIHPSLDQGHSPDWRSAFRRDFARLIHCPSFRRLQGKTQLFAGSESDFFRNRLTHSLEVAQIAKTIGLKLNAEHNLEIDLDLLEFAALAHDLGHPPFGHTGEKILDEYMRPHGGFEANAQTLRILTRLEKKLDNFDHQLKDGWPVWYENDQEASYGLNLCFRSLASIIKYDREIPAWRPSSAPLHKGYYYHESEIVESIRHRVIGNARKRQLKLVECQIMDLADDIAYSTYDLEDAFKGGLLKPLDLLLPPDDVLSEVAHRARQELELDDSQLNEERIKASLERRLGHLKQPACDVDKEDWPDPRTWYGAQLALSYHTTNKFAASGFLRTSLTSYLVSSAIHEVQIKIDHDCPALSRVELPQDIRLEISAFKNLVYVLLIRHQRLKVVAHRGTHIVSTLFEVLAENPALLPADVYERWCQAAAESQKRRVICDFIAGMTDRYAVEFYARLTSDDFHTMFKPL